MAVPIWLAPSARGDAFYTFQQLSDPQGIITGQSSRYAPGTILQTVAAPLSGAGYSFGYWALNGQRISDTLGQAQTIVIFTMVTNDATAIAWYFPTSQDTNSDGIADYLQWRYYGSLTNGPNSDTDGDGFSFSDELARGYSPVIPDQIADGGVMMRLSDTAVYRDASQMKNYVIRSDPQGVIAAQAGYVTNGMPVSTPTITYGATGGYYFGYWEVNGIPQADGSGAALPSVRLPMTNDVLAIARFFSAGDRNTNGLDDWYEWYWFGNLNLTQTNDPDGDGFTIADELARGYSPVISDQIADGGIMMRLSDIGTVGLSYYPRITQVLVNGISQSGFVSMGGASGALSVSSNAAPALGDWNGDNVADMVIGGANGQLRFYQNSGSPIVPNFVEDSLSETALAYLWTNLSNVAPALGDWSGDGLADLAIGGSTNAITLISSVGGFSNAAAGNIIRTLAIAGTTSAIPALALSATNQLCDLYVLRDNGTVDWFPNTGVPTQPFTTSNRLSNILGSAVANATGLAVADMNNDGYLDVLPSDKTGSIYEFRGGSNHTFVAFGAGFAGSYAGFANRLTIAAADLYGNGSADLVGGFAEGGLVYLKNPAQHLRISPPSVTVAAGQAISFGVLNASGAVSWSLLRNISGGSINATNGLYHSGPTGGGMDYVAAVDASGLRGRAYVNVINTNDVASFGKAIVISGGRDLSDPVWPATDYIANQAYNLLLYKGYAKANIQYLSFNTGRDIDGNGLLDDIAGFSSFTNAASTFTNWVGSASRLFIYLVDHGSSTPDGAYFRLNSGEILTSTQLNSWLSAIQNQYQTEAVVVLDFCYAGLFVHDLAYAGPAKRVVIAATSPNELTYFLSGGLVSFSDLFLGGMLEGLNLQQAFLFAQQGMQGYQTPILDDNGDGIYQGNVDGAIAALIPIGATHLAGKDVPIIGAVAGNQTLSVGTTATLWADAIQSYYPIQTVYCSILPPSFSPNTNSGVPVTDVPLVTLTPNGSGRFQSDFGGFTEAGVYRISYYAQDIWGSVSPPQQGLVTQTGFDERMILVLGGTTNDSQWSATVNMAAAAYQTALARRLGKTRIRYLSAAMSQDLDGDGTNDVAAASSLAGLGQAITNWAMGANKLTVYLLGSTTTSGSYRVNATETLGGSQLESWLNGFQATNSSLIVVMDFDKSGAYIPSLVAPSGRERIMVASAQASTTSMRAAGGFISFSQFFLSGIFNGETLGVAFNDARTAIKSASGQLKQTPQLDDNGNGIPDQKNVDGLLAAQRYLGAAFVTGGDEPFIGSVTPALSVVAGTPVLLWARDIVDGVGISNVWCAITAPDYAGQGDLPQTNLLWNPATTRYELLATNFTEAGTYVCTFYARDNAGLVSTPVQTLVTVTDGYEPDDTTDQATIFTLGDTESHSFHSSTDEDWVKFYAATDSVYEVKGRQLGTNSDVRLEIYYQHSDGSLEFIDFADDNGTGVGFTEVLTLDMRTGQSGLLAGMYYVRIVSADTSLFGPGSDYSLQIYVPGGVEGGPVLLCDCGGPLFTIGRFSVYMDPPQAVTAGAGWLITEVTGMGYSNTIATYGLPFQTETMYHVAFRPVAGFLTPSNSPFVLNTNYTNHTTNIQAYYTYTNPSPRAESFTRGTDSSVNITYLGRAGKGYAIEESTNLLNWTPLSTNQIPQDGLLHFTATNRSANVRAFYRAHLVP